jgi:DUF1680 family protein
MAQPPEVTESPIFEDETDFIVDDSAGDELTEEIQDVWADTASIPLQEAEVVPAAAPVQPVAPPVQPAAPVNVDAQVAAMSDSDLEKVIERVAGAVLERIAWEVVPDLAENLIKDEIRKIRENA